MPNKPFFTYEQQIEKLIKEKQLVISDTEFAKETLQKLGYFSLIGGYKDLVNLTWLNSRASSRFRRQTKYRRIRL